MRYVRVSMMVGLPRQSSASVRKPEKETWMSPQESAVQKHDRMVREEMEQAEAKRASADKPADFWQSLAKHFRPPAEPEEDPVVDRLAELAGPDGRVIDVGAGGGRVALPLARHCREVVAVEPSPSMRKILDEAIAQQGVKNVSVVAAGWEEAEVDPADLVFASHVTYGIQQIEPFLRKLDAKATRHAALVAMTDPPQFPLEPFWRYVHGEERLKLPCRDELLEVLRELGVEPEIIPLPPIPPRPLGPRDEALDTLRFRLVVSPGTPEDDRLQQAIATLAEERDGYLYPKDAKPHARQIIRWTPGMTGR